MAVRKRVQSRARTKARGAPAKRTRSVAKRAAAAAGANSIGCVHLHLDYTTHSVEDMKVFYAETLGFTDTMHDPRFDYLMVRTGPRSSLGFMPPMPGPPEQWRPPREPAIYLRVEDVDRAYQELKARGVTFQQEPTDMPWGHRVATVRDPEGRQVSLAQAIAR
jgi:predicted enzyme related to lactoylglutathione lyase